MLVRFVSAKVAFAVHRPLQFFLLAFRHHHRLFAPMTKHSLSQWRIGTEQKRSDRTTLMTFSVVSEAVEIIKAIPCSGEREEGKAEAEDAQKEAWRRCSRRLSTRLRYFSRSFFIYVFYMRSWAC